jgi:hypothetical protein
MRYLAIGALVLSGPAQANLISIDAANYAPGTDVSTASSGVTLSTYTNYGGSVRNDPVYVFPNIPSTDIAPNAFGHDPIADASRYNFHNTMRAAEPCLQGGNCFENGLFYAFLASFDAPTDYVSVNVHYVWGQIDGSLLRAFDQTGNVVASCRVRGSGPNPGPQVGVFPARTAPSCGEIVRRYDCFGSGECISDYTAFVSIPSASIAYVMWGGEAHNATGSFISSLSYNSVPEPSTVGLLAIGCLGFALARRRSTTASGSQ